MLPAAKPAAKTASVAGTSGRQYKWRVLSFFRGGKKSSERILMNFVPSPLRAKQPAYGTFITWNSNGCGYAYSVL